MGQPWFTPDIDGTPVNHFRIDFGGLWFSGVSSMRDGRKGDLFGPYLCIRYAASTNAEIIVDGMPYKRFTPGGVGSGAVGDFSVWGKFVLVDLGKVSYGVRFGTKLPNTPSNKDFGTNQTDFFLHVFAGTDVGAWKVSAYGGIGILDRPAQESQDDLAMGGILAKHALGGGLVVLEAEGFAKSQLYGDNFALHATYQAPISHSFALLLGGQLSHGRLYGNGALRAGLVFTI